MAYTQQEGPDFLLYLETPEEVGRAQHMGAGVIALKKIRFQTRAALDSFCRRSKLQIQERSPAKVA